MRCYEIFPNDVPSNNKQFRRVNTTGNGYKDKFNKYAADFNL